MDTFLNILEPGAKTTTRDRISTSIGDDVAANSPLLISCLMVTRGDIRLISSALHCFDLQTYPNKELVIVYDDKDSSVAQFIEQRRMANVKLVYVEGRRSLGELRNISIQKASGPIVCQWDDDDLYGMDRLRIQAGILIKSRLSAVFLKRWLIWWPAKEILAISSKRIWEGSMLSWKHCIPSYPHIVRGEDTVMVAQLRKTNRIGLLDMPSLYCYVMHSNNTWDESFFAFQVRKSDRQLDYSDLVQIAKVLPFKKHICGQNILSKLEEHSAGSDSNVDRIIIKLNQSESASRSGDVCEQANRITHELCEASHDYKW
jgi:glycosyltransferase involved in cell wall biosynthesis